MLFHLTPYVVKIEDYLALHASGEDEVAMLARILARSGFSFTVANDIPVQVVSDDDNAE